MRTLTKLVGGVFGLVVLVVVAAVGAYALGFVQQPTASVGDVGDWGNVTDEQTEVVTTIYVQNPNSFGVNLGDSVSASYDLHLNDVHVAEGDPGGLSIEPGNNTLRVRTFIDNDKLVPWWRNYVEAEETVSLRAEASVDVGLGPLSTTIDLPPQEQTMLTDEQPIRDVLSSTASSAEGDYSREIGVDEGPISGSVTAGYEVEEGWATWGEVGQNHTEVDLHFRLHNPSQTIPVPAAPDGIEMTTAMNGVEVLRTSGDEYAVSGVGRDDVIEPGETREVVYTVNMTNQKIDDWFRSHVQRGEQTTVETEFQMVFDVRGNEFRLPQGGITYDCEFQTGILVDGQQTNSDCGQAGA